MNIGDLYVLHKDLILTNSGLVSLLQTQTGTFINNLKVHDHCIVILRKKSGVVYQWHLVICINITETILTINPLIIKEIENFDQAFRSSKLN